MSAGEFDVVIDGKKHICFGVIGEDIALEEVAVLGRNEINRSFPLFLVIEHAYLIVVQVVVPNHIDFSQLRTFYGGVVLLELLEEVVVALSETSDRRDAKS